MLCSDVEMVVLGGADIYVKSGHGVDPYIHLPMSKYMDEWRNVWVFLGTTLTCRSRRSLVAAPSSNLTRGTKWPGGTSTSCNPCEVIQQLWQQGLKGADLS
jgi:hypothetical protein